jgi:AraC-like DNA-binding protein
VDTFGRTRESRGGEFDSALAASKRRRKGSDALALAALMGGAGTRIQVRTALETMGVTYFAATPAELLEVLVRHAVDAVLVEPHDAAGSTTDSVVRVIRRDYPSLPVLVYCDLTAEHMRRVPVLVQAGADELVLRGIDDMRSAFRRVLLHSASARAASEALTALSEILPRTAEPLLAYCLTQADRPLTVDRMARDLGVHRKTLCNRAIAAGLPTPSSLISWCRLLHAAKLLDDSGRSVERAALSLGFGSGTALRNMLRRYTGLRPRELRRHGGHRAVLALLQKRLRQGIALRVDALTPGRPPMSP